MDLSQAQPALSLGFHSHAFSPPNPVPLQRLDKEDQTLNDQTPPSPGSPTEDGEDGNQSLDEQFSILGHSVCIKRQRDRRSSPNQPPKRPAVTVALEPAPGLETRWAAVRSWGNQPIQSADPEMYEIMEGEKKRQVSGIKLIASENFVCRAVMEALGSHLINKYSEGFPGARYYKGNQYIDQIESLCCQRALAAFGLDSDKWGVNVQPYSCTSANFAVYTGLLLPGDRIMGLDSPSGRHLSHGYYTPGGKKVSASSMFFESLPYKVNPQTGYIDYDKMEEKALDFRPKILICGGSSYTREWDYARFRQV